MISDHLTHFAGQPVREWRAETGIQEPEDALYRITLDYDAGEEGSRWTDEFARFLADPASGEVRGLVVGAWHHWGGEEIHVETVVEALVAARARLPHLTALFLGDITSEENEISWIAQGDVSPLLDAYPRLEHFGVRGGAGLRLGRLQHSHLQTLVIQTGGLPADVIRQVTAGDLPALKHLELWLGDEGYGGDSSLEDLQPILSGQLFPHLQYLGLCDSEYQDEIARAVAVSPLLERLDVLDLSNGTLGDEGAAALVASPAVRKLRKLDLHYHYLSVGMMEQFQSLGIEVNLDDAQGETPPDERYVAISE